MRKVLCELKEKKVSYKERLIERYKNEEITIYEYKELLQKHEEKLEKRRKFTKGEPITSLDELINQDFIYIYNKIYHRGWFCSLQIGWLKYLMIRNCVCKAIKKEKQNENKSNLYQI